MFMFYVLLMTPCSLCIGFTHKYCKYGENKTKFNSAPFNTQLCISIPMMFIITVAFILVAVTFDYNISCNSLCDHCCRTCCGWCDPCLSRFVFIILLFILLGPIMCIEYAKSDTKYIELLFSKNNCK